MRDYLKKTATAMFLVGDRVGVHVQPNHYYSSVASRRELRATEASWRKPLAPIPFHWDLEEQARWVSDISANHPAELPLALLRKQSQTVGGLRYGEIEAQLLYSVVRRLAPSRIVEVGSGSSTLVMSRAAERNLADGEAQTSIVACDPYTARQVAHLPHTRAEEIRGADVDAEIKQLVAGDVLFIDSTHAVRTGSELAHLYLEVLPQLPPGIIVHVHDIYLPYLFTPDIYRSMFDWQETVLLAALLTGNTQIRILACLSGLHHEQPDALLRAFPEYRPVATAAGIRADPDHGHFPSSIWLETL